MSKLKVLQVNKLYAPVTGGIERVIQEIAEGLNDRVDMKVLVCKRKGKGSVDMWKSVEVHRSSSLGVLFSMPISFAFLRDFRKLSKDRDVVHLHMPFPLGDVACLLSGYKGKVVLSWHSDIVRQKKLMAFYKPFMTWLLRRADAILVATEGHIEGSDYLKPYRTKCVIVPYGAPEPLVEAVERPADSKAPVRFLFVGRLVYYKGCEVLLKAFAQVPHAELVMVGTGPLKENLQEMAKNLKITDRVTFKEDLTDTRVAEEFAQCDVLVLPSVEKSEAFGLVQIEAMSYGKPVINTKLPSGVPYVSLHGETGLTVMPGDVKGLRDAMRKLAADPELRTRLGAAGKVRVKEHFSMEKMLDRVLEVYKK